MRVNLVPPIIFAKAILPIGIALISLGLVLLAFAGNNLIQERFFLERYYEQVLIKRQERLNLDPNNPAYRRGIEMIPDLLDKNKPEYLDSIRCAMGSEVDLDKISIGGLDYHLALVLRTSRGRNGNYILTGFTGILIVLVGTCFCGQAVISNRARLVRSKN